MNQPLVSVCIPTFNGEKYIKEALESIIHQTYKNIEVVVSDDGSSDKTIKIIEQLKNTANFNVYIYSHYQSGIGANWNNCIKNSHGKYIKFLFQDDVLKPNCIEKQIYYVNKYNLEVVCSKRDIIDEKSNKIGSGEWFIKYNDLQESLGLRFTNNIFFFTKKELKRISNLRINYFGEPDTFLFNKEIFKRIGEFNNSYKQIIDLEFTYRILKLYPIGIIDEKLMMFRRHRGQTSEYNRQYKLKEFKDIKAFLIMSFFRYFSFKLKRKWLIRYIHLSLSRKKINGIKQTSDKIYVENCK